MDFDIPKLDLPENPTNADLAKAITVGLDAIVSVHGCLENHVQQTRKRDVVLSGQIAGINAQLNPEFPNSPIAKINAKLEDLSPVASWFKAYQTQKKWVLGALGTIVIGLGSTAVSSVYTALTTQHVAVQQDANAQVAATTANNAKTTAAIVAQTADQMPAYGYAQAKANWDRQAAINEQILSELKRLNAKRHGQ